MPTIGYIRVSTEDQVKEVVSLENQRSKIEAYCQLKELDVTEIIEDAGTYIPNMTHHDGSKFMEKYETRVKKRPK